MPGSVRVFSAGRHRCHLVTLVRNFRTTITILSHILKPHRLFVLTLRSFITGGFSLPKRIVTLYPSAMCATTIARRQPAPQISPVVVTAASVHREEEGGASWLPHALLEYPTSPPPSYSLAADEDSRPTCPRFSLTVVKGDRLARAQGMADYYLNVRRRTPVVIPAHTCDG